MQVDYLSASRIKTFEQCPLQYHAKYELKLPEGPEHPLTTMGKCVHKALEFGMANLKRGHNPNLVTLLDKECLSAGLEKDNQELAQSLLGNAIDWGYLRKADNNVGLEIPFFLSLSNGAKVKGFIDRLDIQSNTAYIIDLKTQQKAFEDDELQDLWQTIIYAWAVRKLFPQVNPDIHVSYWTLRHRVQKTVVDLEYQREAEKKLIAVYNEIVSCTAPEAKPTALCQWCPHVTCTEKNKGAKARFKRWQK